MSKFLFIFGLVSVPLSIIIWFTAPQIMAPDFSLIQDAGVRAAFESAHAQRWGIFVGLWPATLLMLSKIFKDK